MTTTVAVATHNAHKLGELRAILGPALGERARLVSAAELDAAEPVEDGVTFAENALKKARALSQAHGVIAIADDSGLSVDVLGGAPGIFSARWAGRHGDDAANLDLLLAQLADIADEHRAAAFVCSAALVFPDGREQVFEGRLAGRLAHARRGTGGFGYDPILLLQEDGEYRRSVAELAPEEKNAISHRARAFVPLAESLSAQLP
ncbi:RdgB/HAM1 family non-canonical purine NTP pyrophosphatase [Sediminivirga luteola]|uniref:dITP/XTP pyrophosphatase n=1 Tax=Sediminivirga luteola TaxID=1774748 RepID=A0A8J2XL24_9MICO|nr:RdgB/HAM1 family non-canonical purine NTP pyrophosphatase [Sediminivirga luteola]MCI2267185.1 RdgB/HAM1 family non-canonical purine NTP pyrophosphatase [Sediminivirga luteola]GGA19189.1 non-canonical purine NTP pyrophosphatase [Sediminivirga luteola]